MFAATGTRTDPGEILAFAVRQRVVADRAEVNVLVAATEFADVHSYLDPADFDVGRVGWSGWCCSVGRGPRGWRSSRPRSSARRSG